MMVCARTIAAAFSLALVTMVAAVPVSAQQGDAKRGEVIYAQRCAVCHGKEGDADSAASERLNPPPRDFTEGQYKYKTTGFDDAVPNDADLLRMIRDGMPGTSMPGWSDILSGQDMLDLVAYIKTFAGLEEEKPSDQLNYGTQIASSPESIETGQKLFLDRCAECHGKAGKGDAIKKLKDDSGARTWPRNLTKPWTFRASSAPKDIFTRITVGIPGTQMPSFDDPRSKKKLTIDERWHVANYVASLTKTGQTVRPENTVIKASRVDADMPASPDDPRWETTEPTTFFLIPQIIAKQRFFTPSNDTITVRALYNERDIALLLEWDDRTKSIPGDAKAESISDPGISGDSVAVQLPVQIPETSEKPYFGMGDAAHPVNIWQWTSGAANKPEGVKLFDARGFTEIKERDAKAAKVVAKGQYRDGTWRVVIKRPLATGDAENDIQFVEGAFIPVAFAAWDGSNGEKGSKHTMTTWYWLLLKPPTGSTPLIVAVAVFFLIGAGELWWARSVRDKKARSVRDKKARSAAGKKAGHDA